MYSTYSYIHRCNKTSDSKKCPDEQLGRKVHLYGLDSREFAICTELVRSAVSHAPSIRLDVGTVLPLLHSI